MVSDSDDDGCDPAPAKVDFKQYEGHALPSSTVDAIGQQVEAFCKERMGMKASADDVHNLKGPKALVWWGENDARFPVVAWVARHTLCVPASSASSERSFSKAGHILSVRRRRLSGAHVDQINFLSSNRDL